ncbi:peptidoglycan-binding domain-containing protein [Streptomyces sp. NBC_00391]|uniref:peptidoglycan-binding domain-containing protein n=1 Tax=Streptomyces sp. NBC_00391 TaxID=2903647 RepID=UPI002E20CDDE
MSEPTAPVCPQCGTPRATDGTPACSCGRLASEAHRDTRAAQAEAAEDFDPVRIRPFVKVGDENEPVDAAAKVPTDEPRPSTSDDDDATTAALTEPHHAPAAPFDASAPFGEEPPLARPLLDEHPPLDEQPPDDGARGGRRRRRAALATGAGIAAAAVLVTGGIIGGLFSYDAPSRDGSGPDDVRAGLPEAAAGAEASSSTATPSRTASTASPSRTTSASPEATPTESGATPTRSGTPTRTPSNSDATATAAPAPTRSDGRPPVLGLGDQGAEVTELQLRLTQIGFYNADADGDYDREVQSAVRGYQLTRVLLDDESGVYGEATRASLESETSEP